MVGRSRLSCPVCTFNEAIAGLDCETRLPWCKTSCLYLKLIHSYLFYINLTVYGVQFFQWKTLLWEISVSSNESAIHLPFFALWILAARVQRVVLGAGARVLQGSHEEQPWHASAWHSIPTESKGPAARHSSDHQTGC